MPCWTFYLPLFPLPLPVYTCLVPDVACLFLPHTHTPCALPTEQCPPGRHLFICSSSCSLFSPLPGAFGGCVCVCLRYLVGDGDDVTSQWRSQCACAPIALCPVPVVDIPHPACHAVLCHCCLKVTIPFPACPLPHLALPPPQLLPHGGTGPCGGPTHMHLPQVTPFALFPPFPCLCTCGCACHLPDIPLFWLVLLVIFYLLSCELFTKRHIYTW